MKPEFQDSRTRIFGHVLGLLLVIVCWALATSGSPSSLRPGPIEVWNSLLTYIGSGLFWIDFKASVLRVLIAYTSTTILAFTVATAGALFLPVRLALFPILNMARQIPAIALVPFAVSWFGIGEVPKILLVGWTSFFPTWLAFSIAFLKPNDLLVSSARNLGASGLDLAARVLLPMSAPQVLPALRTSLGLALVVLVAAEMTGASSGLGYRIHLSAGLLDMSLAIASLMCLACTGVVLDALFLRVTRYAFPWLKEAQQ